MPNINIYLNWPLRISEPFMFSNISSWHCPLRWKMNDLWKKCILMKTWKIIYHSHPNCTVWFLQIILIKTKGWWAVMVSTVPWRGLPSKKLEETLAFLYPLPQKWLWHFSPHLIDLRPPFLLCVTCYWFSTPVYLFRHLKISIWAAWCPFSSLNLVFLN